MFEQIRLAMRNVPVPMQDIRVGAPLFTNATQGYDISTYAQGDTNGNASVSAGCEIVFSARFDTPEDLQSAPTN